MLKAKRSIQRRLQNSVTDLERFLPTAVQKSYFMLSDAERDVLKTALEKYQPGPYEPIFVGGANLLKPALRLMSAYRLVIDEIKDTKAVRSYTRWVDAVQVRGAENHEVYVTFSPRFEPIWLESKKPLLKYVAQQPPNIGLRSRYALRLYSWARKFLTVGTKRISLEQLRKVLGLESVHDAAGNIIREAPLPVWANLRQRALDVAIAEINEKTDLQIALEALGRSKHRRVTTLTFSIKAQTVPKGDSKGKSAN